VNSTLKSILLYTLSTFLGIIFISSAWFKLISLDSFEINLVETGLVGWRLAYWAARAIIAIELFTGILIVLNFRLRQFSLPVSFGLLLFFTCYLLGILLIKGNTEHCNCFGSIVILNPWQSILKNIVLIAVTFILFRSGKSLEWEHPLVIVSVTAIISAAIPFVADPAMFANIAIPVQTSGSGHANINLLYSDSTYSKPTYEIRKGKQIVAFLSLTCPTCLMTAYKFHVIKKENGKIPVSFILFGNVKDIPRFLDETKTYNIPHTLLIKQDFLKIIGPEVPVVLFLNNGIVTRSLKYLELDQSVMEDWLAESNP
jgi:uncharacterized membrane protein YphA (DoxX/SURF4 family)